GGKFDGAIVFEHACELGFDGIVSKRIGCKRKPGERGNAASSCNTIAFPALSFRSSPQGVDLGLERAPSGHRTGCKLDKIWCGAASCREAPKADCRYLFML